MSEKLFHSSILDTQLKIQAETLLVEKGFEELQCLQHIDIEPKPWQIETAFKVLNDMQGDAILADEVGLGKTIEAGLIIKELLQRKMIKKVLVLVPSPLLEQWKEEMDSKFNLSFFDFKDVGWEDHDLIISSLPYVARSKSRRETLVEQPFDLVVVDEAHSLKNHRTNTYKFVYALKRKNTILMSATPIQNDLKELFNLINLMKPGFFKSRKMFAEEFISNRFHPKNTGTLKELISSIMIRHKRSNTLVELPKRNVHTIEIELNEKEKEFYYDVIRLCQLLYEREILGMKDETARVVLLLVSLLKQNCSSPQATTKFLKKNILPKLQSSDERKLCEKIIRIGESVTSTTKTDALLNTVKELDTQCIVYTEFLETLNTLGRYFEQEGISYVLYHGGLTSKQKNKAVEDFRKGKYQIFLSTESGGQGLNLQTCNVLFNYDLPWNPMRIEQRIGRVHRFGQTKEVQIYTLPTKGTIDEYILYILTSKVNLFEMVIGELDTIMSYMLDDYGSLEMKIGRIILESETPKILEENLRKIGDDLIKAKKEFAYDLYESTKLLDEIGVEEE